MTAAGTETDSDTAIRPYAKNPWYWQYRGRPIMLIGGNWQDNPFQWATAESMDEAIGQLDLLQAVGGNYCRCVINARRQAFPAHSSEGMAIPYLKNGDGRYDLEKWNEEFFARLDAWLREAYARGIIVEMELWDGTLAVNWKDPHNPFRPEHNVNYELDEVILDERGWGNWHENFSQAVPALKNDPILMRYQEALIGRILDVSLQYDNVLYGICNEDTMPAEFAEHWAAFIHQRAQKKGKSVCVTDHKQIYPMTGIGLDQNALGSVIENTELFQHVQESTLSSCYPQEQYDSTLALRQLVREQGAIRPINYDKSFWFIQSFGDGWREKQPGNDALAAMRLWIGVFAGAASYTFHRDLPADPGWTMGLGLNPLAQTHLKSMRMLLDTIDIFGMEPASELISGERCENQAYVLAEPGKQYAVYFPGADYDRDAGRNRALENRIQLELAPGAYTLKRLDIAGNRWESETKLEGGKQTVEAPAGQQALVAQRACP